MKGLHWTRQPERASNVGIIILMTVLRITGPGVVKVLTAPIALYYYLASSGARKHSRAYLLRFRQAIKQGAAGRMLKGPFAWLVFRHLLSFAQSLVDRADVWCADANKIRWRGTEKVLLDSVVSDSAQGALFLVSHLGNFDLAMKSGHVHSQKRFNVFLNGENSVVFNRFRLKFMQANQLRFIDAANFTMSEIMRLMGNVANGEIVAIAADRTVDDANRNNIPAKFLGDTAMFPAGPYILAHVLKVPTYTLFTFKHRGVCRVLFQLFEREVHLPRHDRKKALQCYVQKYAAILEKNCLQYPLHWYNFYDFWQK